MDYNIELLNIPVTDLLSSGSTKINNNFEAIEDAMNDLRTIAEATAGENLAEHQLVYGSGGEYFVATNNDTEAKADAMGITLEAISSGNTGTIQFGNGIITDETWTWTPGAELFLGEDGALVEDYGEATFVKPIGYAVTATSISFNIQLGYNQVVENISLVPDTLELYYVPTNYTPALTPGTTKLTELGSHLKGIDTRLVTYPSTWYWADQSFLAKTVSVAADRYKLLTPNAMQIDIGGSSFTLEAQVTIDLSVAANWDDYASDSDWDGTNYTTASNRAGKDFYVFAVTPPSGTAPRFLLSANSTIPLGGYDASTSRKLGGFHCLCTSVGTISGHTLTGYVQGDVLPASVWDLKFRPYSNVGGLVYDNQLDLWVMIYLQSGVGASTRSANGATIADTRMWQEHANDMMAIGCYLPDNQEFQSFSRGANQQTNISGSADPGTTTGHTDTAGRRMISNIGCEDCCGVMWQRLRDQAYRSDGVDEAAHQAWNWHDDWMSGSVYQQGSYGDVRVVSGGGWDYSTKCGSMCRLLDAVSWALPTTSSARGVSRTVRR